MKDVLKEYFGFEEFRPLQREIIECVMEGRDAFVLMPTGGGKSLCFQVPALLMEGVTLVISPLIALMKDQVDGLKANGVAAEFINSSLSGMEIRDIQERLAAGEVKILYIAPERLALGEFREFLSSLKINLIAIDEAHCISEWGHDFRPDYRNLRNLKEEFGAPMIALTATATLQVRTDILKQLSLEKPGIFVSSFDRPNLCMQVIRKQGSFDKLSDLLEKHKGESVIIYCFSRNETEKLSAKLKKNGFKALPYHAGLDVGVRRRTQELFVRDEVDIIAATIAFGMGIDKPDVRLVVHTAFPKTLEGYYQEIGRAGRDGLPSECALFYSYGDMRKHQFFVDLLDDNAAKAEALKKLRWVTNFCEVLTCRRRFVLRYFGEEFERECGNCDRCLNDEEKFDATEVAQKILSCVIRLNSRFGKNYVIDVLKGKDSPKVIDWGHDKLSVFGIVEDFSIDDLRQIVDALVALNILDRSEGKYPILSVSEKGGCFLMNKERLELPRPHKKVKKSKKWKKPLVIDSKEVDYDSELFEKLRVLRKRLADEAGVPPFVVFGDVSLKAMCHFLPKSEAEFLEIHGVGNSKLEKYGSVFMGLIGEHVESA